MNVAMKLEALDAALSQVKQRRSLPPPSRRRLLRESAGLSQATLAQAVEVDRATISRWESGEREPEAAHLEAYLKVLERLERLAQEAS
jgi:transcriptional regulator with XRE-family HTH domain